YGSTLGSTAITINSPITTVFFKMGSPDQYVTVSDDYGQSQMAMDSNTVYVSPGYVGCKIFVPSVGNSLYTLVPPISGIHADTYFGDPRGFAVTVWGYYDVLYEADSINLTIGTDEMRLFGDSQISKGYGGFYSSIIRLDWTKKEGSRDAFALQFTIKSYPLYPTTPTSVPTITSTTNGPSTRQTTASNVPSTAPTTAYHLPSTAPTTIYHPPSTRTTKSDVLLTTPSTSYQSTYCNCPTKFGLPLGWDYNQIWVDLVVILDTSEAMGKTALEGAESLIESFLSDGVNNFLITDSSAPFYSRVGVISMADSATILYDLNMTNSDTMQGKASIKRGVKEIDVVAAFAAALNMFKDGLTRNPERVGARQVVYYMTDSDPKTNLDAPNQFKERGVVNAGCPKKSRTLIS
ncbi:hypothetical protein PMAYCL1PPCAC_00378, partial [Pristionchus mayeri]